MARLRRWAPLMMGIALAGCAHATAAPRVAAPVLSARDEPRELAVDQQVKQALTRLTYGARLGDEAAVLHEGLDSWLLRQLTPENWRDAAADSAMASFPVERLSVRDLVDASPPLDVFLRRRRRELALPDTARYTMTADDSARFKTMTELGNRRVQQYLAAKLARAVVSDQQLAELMTDFWENHFSVFRGKMPTQFTLLEYDRDVIRPRALGRFRDLLGAVAHSAAMLYYLDGYQSSADSGRLTLTMQRTLTAARSASDSARVQSGRLRRRGGLNENYGRELLELHTLGVEGGYTQADVIAAARAFTGWGLDAPREGGGFRFNPGAHDAEPKVVLGHLLPAGQGEEDGEELLDLLARHPNTARFIATKLVRHFVADVPPSTLVSRAAATFVQTDGDIRQVMATIVSSPEFYSRAAVRAKVKTPYELVASTYRVTGGRPDTTGRSVQLVAQLGEPLFGHLTPEGWPDVADAWMNTGALLARINFGISAGTGRVPGISADRWPFAPALASALTRAEQLAVVGAVLLQGEMSAETHDVLVTGMNPLVETAVPAANRGRDRPAATAVDLVGLALASPEFQRR